MKVNRALLTALTVATIGAGVVGVGTVAAAAQTSPSASPMSGLVTAIATKFNLNPSDVQQVFDDQHAKMEAQHQQVMADRIRAAVTSGTIKQAQADAITAKLQEMKGFLDTLRDKTPEERRAAMKTKMDDLKQWADANNIPADLLPFGRGGHMGMRGDMHGSDGDADDGSVTTTTSTN